MQLWSIERDENGKPIRMGWHGKAPSVEKQLSLYRTEWALLRQKSERLEKENRELRRKLRRMEART